MFAAWSRYASIPLRLGLGVIFFVHGAQKLFGWFGGSGLEGTAQTLGSLGLVPGNFWAVVVALLETFGGAALLLGLLTRWVALALALEMAVALVLVHLPAGFAATQGGVEFPLALLAGLVALACLGAPVWALDASLPALAPATGSEPAEPEAARRAA